jgi:hypothetical protein
MTRPVKLATGIVLLHLAVNLVHGAAHAKLQILLDPPATAFVVTVILFLPLLAMALLWTSRQRLGWLLLTASMAAALLFGAFKHFWEMSPDHVGQQLAGPWASAFAVTAYLLLLTEAAGTYVGLRNLPRRAS